MKNYILIATVLLLLLVGAGLLSPDADAQWRSKTHDEYNALTGD